MKCPQCGKEMQKIEGMVMPEPPLWKSFDPNVLEVWVCNEHGVVNVPKSDDREE